jgi:nicotinamidase/pyrazinamidase
VIAYDPTTALVIVDVQNDFADPSGSLAVAGGDQVVQRINQQIDEVRAAGGLVVYTQDWHPESTPHFAKDGGIWPVHCVQNTWGARLHPKLAVSGPTIRKGEHGEDGYSGFTMRDPESGETRPTALESTLRQRRIERVVLCGLATDYCVRATALDAAALGFQTQVLTDAIAAVNLQPDDGEQALREIADAGVELLRPVDSAATPAPTESPEPQE